MQTDYSQANPSPRYRELIAQYQQLHNQGAVEQGLLPQQTFPGQSLLEHIGPLVQLVEQGAMRTMLDYGCGKAMLYRPQNRIELPDGRSADTLQGLLGVDVTLYDPAYLPYAMRPHGQFDLVVCTDVLEHCSSEDIGWILDDLFRYAHGFVYANVACYAAKKTLPNGENAPCLVRDVAWWQTEISTVARAFPDVGYRFLCTYGDGRQFVIRSS
ncbi:MAG: class I SAM-dependent methyltransferase [Pseudomonadota bacterium]